MSNKVICPECHAALEHDRGYLPTHMKGIQRGQLVTGSQVCDLSNTKVVLECKRIEYAAECPNCGTECSIAISEEYPGAFGDRPREAWMTVDCIGCSRDHDGYYCTDPACGLELEERTSVFFRVSPLTKEWKGFLPPHLHPSGDKTKGAPVGRLRRYSDFDSEAEAQDFIDNYLGTPVGHPDDNYTITEMPPGWYAAGDGTGVHDGGDVCIGAQRDLKRVALGDEHHRPQFQIAARHPVQLFDQSAVFQEEPEPGDDDPAKFLAPGENAVLICSCCNLARPELPFHHEAHDDSGRFWDYCQECENAGCDLIDCNVRAAQRAATMTH